MLSERQMTPTSRAQINQANAQHSTGPKTEAGKHRSSLNALRHGLTGQIIVLPSDDLKAYQRHINAFQQEYNPKGVTEANLVQTLAETAWRQHRVAALENNVLTLGIVRDPSLSDDVSEQVQQALAIAASLDSQTRALSNLSIHGQRLSRQFEKTLALLQKLQLARKLKEDCRLDQASALVQMHALKEEPYDPADDGFVFSKDQLETYIRENDLSERAAQADQYCQEEQEDRDAA
jgi:hypothetical protein